MPSHPDRVRKNYNTPTLVHNVEERLFEKRIIDSVTNCWLWTGAKIGEGYGVMSFNYEQVGVHRISAHLYLGYDLNDKANQINHKLNCPNLNCFNPEHIYIGTQLDNNLDTLQTNKRIHFQKTHCKNGHEFNEKNTYEYKTKKGTIERRCKVCHKMRKTPWKHNQA